MAHEIENMAYVGATPWHELGDKYDVITVENALRAAGLDWSVRCEALVLASDTASCDSLDECRAIPARAVIRSTDGKVLGVVGMDYRPVQNAEKLSIIAPLVASGAAHIETAGSLRGGSRVWLLANMGLEGEVTRGDAIKQRLLVCGAHDGSMAVRVQECAERVVCRNTLTIALGEGGRGVVIRHTRNAGERVKQVADVVATAQRNFAASLESYRFLASRKVTDDATRAYVKAVFAQRGAKPASAPKSAPVAASSAVDAASVFPGMFGLSEHGGRKTSLTADDVMPDTAGDRVADRVMQLVDGGRGAEMARGTAWGAYNAVTEYLTHLRGSDADTRLDSNWFGNGAALNHKALELALDMASGKAVR
jgi:phage/plasmid-like protein (TIGR03299 family)